MAISRSQNMARIRGARTRPETVLHEALAAAGLAFEANGRTPVGRPDLVDAERHVAVFIDGCFWHGCPDHYVRPRSREEFWSAKLKENVARDRRQTAELVGLGWIVVRLWECDINERLDASVEVIRAALDGTRAVGARWVVVSVESLDSTGSLERRQLETLNEPVRARYEDGRRSTRKRGRREPGPR
jgi:DNA mismatch endonuclease (patch repair protein)